MDNSAQIAKHLKEVFFGGNWTTVNIKEVLADVSWQHAIAHVHDFNCISVLTCHIGYYISAVLKVMNGGVLDAKDELSFNTPSIVCDDDWQKVIAKLLNEARQLVSLIEVLPEGQLEKNFFDEKYGNYYRNLNGIIEHTHYHLGQIVLLKKIIEKEQTKQQS